MLGKLPTAYASDVGQASSTYSPCLQLKLTRVVVLPVRICSRQVHHWVVHCRAAAYHMSFIHHRHLQTGLQAGLHLRPVHADVWVSAGFSGRFHSGGQGFDAVVCRHILSGPPKAGQVGHALTTLLDDMNDSSPHTQQGPCIITRQ